MTSVSWSLYVNVARFVRTPVDGHFAEIRAAIVFFFLPFFFFLTIFWVRSNAKSTAVTAPAPPASGGIGQVNWSLNPGLVDLPRAQWMTVVTLIASARMNV